MHFSLKDSDRAAFTLVELLSVIAILAILIAILIPIVGSVRDRSHLTKCAANLRSIGQGTLLYSTENGGELPPGAEIDKYTNWYHLLEPYVGQFITDPESADRLDWQLCPAKTFDSPERRHIGYGWNYLNFGSRASSPDHGWRTKLINVEKPSDTIICGCSADIEVVQDSPWMNIYIYDESYPERHARRHDGGGNYLMVDGSVRFILADDLLEALPEIYKVKKWQ